MENKQILLLATERSGTNLLRAILSSHSQISSPPPSGMVGVIAGTSFKYLTGKNGSHFPALVKDAIQLTKTHLNPWDIELKEEQVMKKVQRPSFWELFKVLHDCYAESEKKYHWFSKEPGLFKYIDALALNLPEASFVYMVRDPRDVVASMLKGKLHAQNTYMAACKWRDEQRLCLNALAEPLLQDRVTLLKYEELISDTGNVIQNLMQRLGLTLETKQLEFYKNNKVIEHAKKSEFWRKLSQPVDTNNKNKYKAVLSSRQIKLIENICSEEMKALGYASENTRSQQVPVYAKGFFHFHEYMMKKINYWRLSEETAKHRERKRKVSEIRKRSFD